MTPILGKSVIIPHFSRIYEVTFVSGKHICEAMNGVSCWASLLIIPVANSFGTILIQGQRKAWKSMGASCNVVGIICLPVWKGLTYLQKCGGENCPLSPGSYGPDSTILLLKGSAFMVGHFWIDQKFEHHSCKLANMVAYCGNFLGLS